MQAVGPVILAVVPEVRLFWALVQRSFARQLSYRSATLAGLATNLFFGFLRVAVMAP